MNFRGPSSHHGLLKPLPGGRGSAGQGIQRPVFLSPSHPSLNGFVVLGKSLLCSEPQFPCSGELFLPPLQVRTKLTHLDLWVWRKPLPQNRESGTRLRSPGAGQVTNRKWGGAGYHAFYPHPFSLTFFGFLVLCSEFQL